MVIRGFLVLIASMLLVAGLQACADTGLKKDGRQTYLPPQTRLGSYVARQDDDDKSDVKLMSPQDVQQQLKSMPTFDPSKQK